MANLISNQRNISLKDTASFWSPTVSSEASVAHTLEQLATQFTPSSKRPQGTSKRNVSETCRSPTACPCMVCAKPPNFPKEPCGGWKGPLLASLRAMGALEPRKQWFHLKDLYKFIEAHWDVLRPSLLQTRDTKEWHKQLQDVLSHNKHLFVSARGLIGKNGYWRLVEWGECMTFEDSASSPSPSSALATPTPVLPSSSSPPHHQGYEDSPREKKRRLSSPGEHSSSSPLSTPTQSPTLSPHRSPRDSPNAPPLCIPAPIKAFDNSPILAAPQPIHSTKIHFDTSILSKPRNEDLSLPSSLPRMDIFSGTSSPFAAAHRFHDFQLPKTESPKTDIPQLAPPACSDAVESLKAKFFTFRPLNS